MSSQYPVIPSEEVNKAAEHDPQRALLMVLGNSTLREASQMVSGAKQHEPRYHESGWSIALQTPNGVIGLWSCWLNNQFYLGYPKRTSFAVRHLPDEMVLRIANNYLERNRDKFLLPPENGFDLEGARRLLTSFKMVELVALLHQHGVQMPDVPDGSFVPDNLIMDVLGVEYASEVPQIDGTAVQPGYEGECKDTDKPLVETEHGQTIAYHTRGMRKWAEFFGPRQPGNKGRVWIDHSEWNSNGHHFDVIDENGRHSVVSFGHDHSRGISTFQFSFYNEYAPDGPTADPEAVQLYRAKFLQLFCEIAKIMGSVQAVNINYGFVVVPEQLEQLGYTNVTWLKGQPGERQGWDNERLFAEKETENGKEVLFLKSANSLVPWVAIRRIPNPSGELTPEQLETMLTF
jgi:hypothetical protein